METLKAIIIDDEERARKTLSTLIREYVPEITVADMASNVPDGVLSINKHKPDVVFLDIEMPDYNGFELLNFFREIDFDIVFVTAYSEYALRAFEVSATDYILKPVEVDSIRATLEKIKNRNHRHGIKQKLELLKETVSSDEIKKIALPMGDGLLFVETAKIILIEADGAYSSVHINDGSTLVVSKNLKFFEDILENKKNFYRPHRSHLINLNYIKKYHRGENNIIMDNQTSVSISRDKKNEFEGLLRDLHLSV